MMDVAHLDDDVIGVEIALAVRQAQVGDIGRIGREDARHLGERAGLVEDDDAQSRLAPPAVLLPAQVDPVRVPAVGQARALDDMPLAPFAWPPYTSRPVPPPRAPDRVRPAGAARR